MKVFISCLLIPLLASCSSQLDTWASRHSLSHSAVNAVAGTYQNGRAGKMRPDSGLWFILTGEDTDVDSSVSLNIDEQILIIKATIDGQQQERRIKYNDKGRFLVLPARNYFKTLKVPVVFMHGSDHVAIGATDEKLFVHLSAGGTVYVGILPMLSAGSPFDISYDRQQ